MSATQFGRRRVGRWGHSLVVTLSPEEARVLGVTKGSELVGVVTGRGTLELHPLDAAALGAVAREPMSDRVRELGEELRRARAQAREAYQAGFTEGCFKGATLSVTRAVLELVDLREELRAVLAELRAEREGRAERRP